MSNFLTSQPRSYSSHKKINVKLVPLKTPGVKNGEDAFMLAKIGVTPPNYQSQQRPNKQEEKPLIDMKQLQLDKNFHREKVSDSGIEKEKNISENINKKISFDRESIKKEFQKIVSKSGIKGPDILNTDLNYGIKLPKGVDSDELNAYEMKFFIFNRRVFESYVKSLLISYEKIKKKYPSYEIQQLPPDKIAASVIYDEDGNVKKINISTPSYDQNLEKLFIDALASNRIMNPPKILIENHEFTCSYELLINAKN